VAWKDRSTVGNKCKVAGKLKCCRGCNRPTANQGGMCLKCLNDPFRRRKS